MSAPSEHALLSASSAARWLRCTPSPRFELRFPERSSEYALEGSLAHAVCELKVIKAFGSQISDKEYTEKINELMSDSMYNDELERATESYIEHLKERAMQYSDPPSVIAEARVELGEYVPDGFGTCDCIMIGGDTLSVIDYKHGKGVPVSAKENPQIRLYALGALRRYAASYGNTLKRVCMVIDQPRISKEPDCEELTVSELYEWGESIKPIAQKAYMGLGEFVPGEHCRFCRGKERCKARASRNTELEVLRDCELSDDEIGELLIKGKGLVEWYRELEEHALTTILNGGSIPGWKAVRGRSIRVFTDTDAAFAAALEAGYDESVMYERRPRSPAELERLMGKAEFVQRLGAFVCRPSGKPTLVLSSDKRPPLGSAEADFWEVSGNV